MAKGSNMGDGKNWKQLRSRESKETLRNRDVYETQQLERSKILGKQTMTSRAILAGAVSLLAAVAVWTGWSLVDSIRGTLDSGEVEMEVITEPAPSVPRSFTDLEYANMRMEPTDYYASFGYGYYDIYTKTFYTKAEYDQWAYVQKRLESGELKLAQLWDEHLGRYVYTEREYLAPVDPTSVRELDDLEWLNMRLVSAKLYDDIGYTWADLNTLTYYTQAEYDHWLNVTQGAISRYNNGDPTIYHEVEYDENGNPVEPTTDSVVGLDGEGYDFSPKPESEPEQEGSDDTSSENDGSSEVETSDNSEELDGSDSSDSELEENTDDSELEEELPSGLVDTEITDPEMEGKYVDETGEIREIKSSYVVILNDDGSYYYTITTFNITPEQYLNGRWRSKSYLTVTVTTPAADANSMATVTRYMVNIDAAGNIMAVATLDDYNTVYELAEPIAVTKAETIATLAMNYRSYSWYDAEAVTEREVVTEQASVVPREFDDLTWANMMLMQDNSYVHMGYNFLDIRTGKFYTQAEYAQWNVIQQRINNGEIKLWRQESTTDDGYIYAETPPMAPSDPRQKYAAYTDKQWMAMTLVEATAWTDYGWHYADPETRLYYSDAEYALWQAVQDKIASGEIVVPQAPQERSFGEYMADFKASKFFGSLLISGGLFAIMYQFLKKNLDAQNLLNDTSDINQYENDQHIALPEEVQRKFDWFPDVGAHSPVQVSSMISHMMLNNKGLNPVLLAERAKKDMYDEDGDIEYYKGEILLDDEGNEKTKKVPMIDMDFGEALFEASGNPKDIRKFYDTTKIPYNPGGADRSKQAGEWDTVAEMINNEWKFPLYEPQRPAGAYIVDTEPVNTMVLAITRAGKGQTVIEPTLDMWTREMRPNNMVVNDPKGELLVKFYVRGTIRGFQIVQFNLINAMKTDIYNPLGMAADAAREGDFVKCAMYVDNIAGVFFPVDGGDDPVWPNAANNAFKRAAYGLMDFYLEEEKELRRRAEREGMDEKLLETQIDVMWGKMTLYNCYQMFVQLTSKKLKNPASEFQQWSKEAKSIIDNCPEDQEPYSDNPDVQRLIEASNEEYEEILQEINAKKVLWEDKPETDLLSLYFTATDMLPRNSMRVLVGNANNALKSMAGAEKMLSSVYGIAITAMAFFTDPTISTLTSGTPSQNVDLAGMSFPRRLGVRFHSDYVAKYHYVGLQVKWDAFEDEMFTKPLGKDFDHEDVVTREGWARYFFKGIFPNDVAYLRMRILNASTAQLINVYYFQFTKSYQTSLDGRVYIKDPVLGEKIVKNGTLVELKPVEDENGQVLRYEKAKTFFEKDIVDFASGGEKKRGQVGAIIRTLTRYAEKPKMVFLVTPPHLMNYAKLILILVKQLVDLNFDQSYMTKSNQKPLYKTRFMLDELGNLQSEGHGISGFETMLSIGLGQEQQFTLILQTLQQLKDVYGDSVDKIVQGNTSNIVFLKSTDDAMLDTLQKMSGTTHKAYINSKTISRDMEKLWMKNAGNASYTMSVSEAPVISYNDMAFIPERNSIVFRAGDAPVWNRNETILPMSWRLFKTTITQPGKDYSLQTIPTLSSALDFDIRQNQPDFSKMLEKRMKQAIAVAEAKVTYQKAYGYTDAQIAKLDIDSYSDELMDLIMSRYNTKKDKSQQDETDDLSNDGVIDNMDMGGDLFNFADVEENEEQLEANREQAAKSEQLSQKRYAGNKLSRRDLYNPQLRTGTHSFDADIIAVFRDITGDFRSDTANFVFRGASLYGTDGRAYIIAEADSDALRALKEAARDEESGVYAESDEDIEKAGTGTFTVTNEFYAFLTACDYWDFARGKFEEKMARRISDD